MLTATPMEKSTMDIYGVFNCMDESIFSGGKTRFEHQYLIPDMFNTYKNINQNTIGELNKFIDNYIFAYEQILDIPTKIFPIYLTLTPQERASYEKISEYYKEQRMQKIGIQDMNSFTEDEIRFFNAQVNFDSFNEKYKFIDHPSNVFEHYGNDYISQKSRWLIENLHKIEGKVLLFDCRVQANEKTYKDLTKVGYEGIILSGDVSQKNREKLLKEFRYNPDKKFLLSTNLFSYGKNLQYCNNMVFLNLDPNPVTMLQKIWRIRRTGQDKTVYFYFLITLDTIEDKMFKYINIGIDTQNKLVHNKITDSGLLSIMESN